MCYCRAGNILSYRCVLLSKQFGAPEAKKPCCHPKVWRLVLFPVDPTVVGVPFASDTLDCFMQVWSLTVDVPKDNHMEPTSTQRDYQPNQTTYLPIARYVSKICRRHYPQTSGDKNIEFGVTLCECNSVVGHDASCTTRRTSLSTASRSSAATPPNEATHDNPEQEEFMGKLMHLGKLVGVPCYIEGLPFCKTKYAYTMVGLLLFFFKIFASCHMFRSVVR